LRYTTPVSQIHFVGGEKGGVGKSVMARVLAQRFIDRARPFAALDADQSAGALLRYYGDYTQPIDLLRTESADEIMDRALGADRAVLVDLPAQSARSLWDWFTGANVFDFAREMGVGLTLWQVTDGGFASVAQLERALTLFGPRVRHVLVRNYGRGRDFSQLERSSAMQMLGELSGSLLDLPELEGGAMFAIDRLGSSFWAAVNREGEGALRPLERQRVRLWLERCAAGLEAIGE
jgi:hypothetical protein